MKAKNLIIDELDSMSTKITTVVEKMNIAMISSNGDTEISKLVCEAFSQADNVVVEKSLNLFDDIIVSDGYNLNVGYSLVNFINNDKTISYDAKDVLVLCSKDPIVDINKIVPYLQSAVDTKKGIVIVCKDITEEAELTLLRNKMESKLNICVVKNIIEQDLEDLASFCNTKTISIKDDRELVKIGSIDRVIIKNDSSSFINDEKSEGLELLLSELKDKLSIEKDKSVIDTIDNRIKRLTENTCVIRIGSLTSNATEVSERFDIYDDVVKSLKSAIDHGVVEGALFGLSKAFINAESDINKFMDSLSLRESIEKLIYSDLLHEDDPDVAEAIMASKIGYNIFDLEDMSYDMKANGVIDSVQMMKVIVENAFNYAAIFVSRSGSIVIDK